MYRVDWDPEKGVYYWSYRVFGTPVRISSPKQPAPSIFEVVFTGSKNEFKAHLRDEAFMAAQAGNTSRLMSLFLIVWDEWE